MRIPGQADSMWQCMFIIALAKSFLQFAATPPFALVMTEAPSDTKAFKFSFSMASSWNVLVFHEIIASASGVEASSSVVSV